MVSSSIKAPHLPLINPQTKLLLNLLSKTHPLFLETTTSNSKLTTLPILSPYLIHHLQTSFSICCKNCISQFFNMQIKKLETMTSRTGRQMQRYNQGCRQVVGCIPFRFRKVKESSMIRGSLIDEIEVLLISSQKGPQKLMFPKGGWELDEELAEAACRETFEEAGVVGTLMNELGIWNFKSNSQGVFHEGRMLPLFVEEVRDVWPEKNVRHRIWMSIDEARERCAHIWMKEALDVWSEQLLSLSLSLNRNGSRTPLLRDFLCPRMIMSIAAQSDEHTWMKEALNVWIDQIEPTFLGEVEYCLYS